MPGPIFRGCQFFRALGARRRPPDLAAARSVLPDGLFDLFARMPAEDQRHALAVLALLRRDGQTDRVLLQAGLLHDVGKAEGGVGLRHRVARVLLRRALPPAWHWLSGTPSGWRRPYWVVAEHANRGAEWIASRGGEADLVALVRHHERKAPAAWAGTDLARWHAALARADSRD